MVCFGFGVVWGGEGFLVILSGFCCGCLVFEELYLGLFGFYFWWVWVDFWGLYEVWEVVFGDSWWVLFLGCIWNLILGGKLF